MTFAQGNMEQQLAKWGRQLDAFKKRSDEVGADMIDDLQQRYDEVKATVEGLEDQAQKAAERTSHEIATTRDKAKAAADNARSQAGKARAEAEALASQARDAGADIGDGFAMAWDSLRRSFDRAQKRLNS